MWVDSEVREFMKTHHPELSKESDWDLIQPRPTTRGLGLRFDSIHSVHNVIHRLCFP